MSTYINSNSNLDFIGVVIPAFNEATNLEQLLPKILKEINAIDSNSRIVVVDDGSTDETNVTMRDLKSRYSTLEILTSNSNKGKANALSLGFKYLLDLGASRIVMMDADGQDSPDELIHLLKQLDENGGLVTGARLIRRDRFIKRWTSKLFNRTTRLISGVPGQDFNSGYKAMTSECAQSITPFLYGDLHRYITVIAHWEGFKTSEVPVEHHERLYGETKYGVNRFWRGLIDLITIRFLLSYGSRPAHLFGTAGVINIMLGTLMLINLLLSWSQGNKIGDRPMLIISVLLLVVGVQLISFGLLAELLILKSKRQTPISFMNRN